MTSSRHLTGSESFGSVCLQAKHKECSMKFRVEINDDIVDTLVCESVHFGITGEQVADLRDYLEACGYDWNEVAYVWEMCNA